LAKSPAPVVVDTALKLLRAGGSANRLAAYELICHHPAALASLNGRTLERLGKDIVDWAAVDTFACYLLGRAWRGNQVSDSFIAKWSRSSNRWRRRAALVATVPLNNKTQGGQGDSRRTLTVCSHLVDDRDDMVVKALSWALRELSKRDAQAVKAFIDEREEHLAPRVLREVGNKLSTGRKNPSKKS
jgi:3-methyladenine DNA glycosylase AlkD